MSLTKYLKTRVVGAQYHPGAQTRLNTMKHGDVVTLEREPENRHDPNAVAVYSAERVMLGYVPARDVQIIAAAIDGKMRVEAFIDANQPKLHIVYNLPGVDPTVAPADAAAIGDQLKNTGSLDDW